MSFVLPLWIRGSFEAIDKKSMIKGNELNAEERDDCEYVDVNRQKIMNISTISKAPFADNSTSFSFPSTITKAKNHIVFSGLKRRSPVVSEQW